MSGMRSILWSVWFVWFVGSVLSVWFGVVCLALYCLALPVWSVCVVSLDACLLVFIATRDPDLVYDGTMIPEPCPDEFRILLETLPRTGRWYQRAKYVDEMVPIRRC